MTTTIETTAAAMPVSITSPALGTIEIDPAAAIRLLEPLAGFPECRSYALVPHMRGGTISRSIQWLQALQSPFQAFIVADPWSVFPEYSPEIAQGDADQLGLGSREDARLLVILTVPAVPSGITANLRAPIVVNTGERVAKQVVLLGDAYHTRHEVRRAAA